MQREQVTGQEAASQYDGHAQPERDPGPVERLITARLPAEARRQGGGRRQVAPVAGVHVTSNIVRQVLTPEHDEQERRDLDEVVHRVLIVGLVLSTALMLAGVGLELARGTALPEAVLGLGQVFPRLVALRPSGFLTLGLLVLIATPILRVLGSIAAFLYERDWHFVGVTALVLLVMVASIVLGRS